MPGQRARARDSGRAARAGARRGGERPRALLYVRFHGLAVGFERAGEEKDWKLVKVKPWFERRLAESWAE